MQILRFSSINPSCVLKCFKSSEIKKRQLYLKSRADVIICGNIHDRCAWKVALRQWKEKTAVPSVWISLTEDFCTFMHTLFYLQFILFFFLVLDSDSHTLLDWSLVDYNHLRNLFGGFEEFPLGDCNCAVKVYMQEADVLGWSLLRSCNFSNLKTMWNEHRGH